eukprot:3435_1
MNFLDALGVLRDARAFGTTGTVSKIRALATIGRCALTRHWGEMERHVHAESETLAGLIVMARVPGSNRVLDVNGGLEYSSTSRCPHSVDAINFASLSHREWIHGVNSRSSNFIEPRPFLLWAAAPALAAAIIGSGHGGAYIQTMRSANMTVSALTSKYVELFGC